MLFYTHEKKIELNIPVIVTEAQGEQTEWILITIGLDGVEVKTHRPPKGRYVWLEFILPFNAYRIKTLCEIIETRMDGGHTNIFAKYKHIFPRDRKVMNEFVQARYAA